MTKQATLKELVQGAVEGFLATNTSFSVHDITKSIRQVVNSGAVAVPNLSVFGQAFKYDISHNDVKFYFTELLVSDSFSQPLSRSFNGTYFIYYGKSVPASVNPIGAVADAMKNLGSVLAGIKANPPSIANSIPQAGKLDRQEVINRVRTYKTNCRTRNFTPTTKQIQSAIKRGSKSTGWTRAELKQIWQSL